jgi:signal transduction histidine kinase
LRELVLAGRGAVVFAAVQHILAPAVQHLPADRSPDGDAVQQLHAIMSDRIFAAEFPYLDLWLADGTIFYSSTPAMTGRTFELLPAVRLAFGGEIEVGFTDTHSADYREHYLTRDYIEIFLPLRDQQTGEVVAVAQLREETASLESDLFLLTISSWATAAIVGVIVVMTLFSIVVEGGRKIERQGRILSRRLAQSHARAAHHQALKAEAQQVSRSVTELTDKHLRTIGTDLHDGPAQLIGFAVLKLDQIRHLARASERDRIVSDTETILRDALSEIRSIAVAVVLPDIADLDLPQVIDRAVEQHVSRTASVITLDSRVKPVHVAPEVAVCVFRFIQEGLNNAFHHGLPETQALSAVLQDSVLKLSISNTYDESDHAESADHLGIGLYGLRARVQSIGGQFAFVQADGRARLEMWLRHV